MPATVPQSMQVNVPKRHGNGTMGVPPASAYGYRKLFGSESLQARVAVRGAERGDRIGENLQEEWKTLQEWSRAHRVYRAILAAIQAGAYGEGDPLPNQAALARQLGSSVGTLRKALDRLAREGYVAARHGSGTYVRSRQPERPQVLVVDDDLATRLALQALLDDLGYSSEAAASGAEALARVQERRYSHVLLDLRMHGMTGLEVAQHLRDLDPSVVVVFVTGYPTDLLQTDRASVWPALVLRKPFDVDELRRSLSVRVETSTAD